MAAALERALGSVTAAEPDPGSGPVPVLVLGPAGSGRTSLLLRAALAGGGDGPRALFLAPSALPRLPGGGGGNDPRALQRLELRYPPTAGALGRELAAAAARPRPPGLLLLDGLERYVGPAGNPARAARLAALLLEAARGPGPPRPPAQVVASLLLPPPGPRVLPALRRFFPAECRLRALPGAGPASPPGVPPRRLRACLSRPGAPRRRWRLRFGSRGRLRAAPDDGDTDGDSDDDGEDDSGGAGEAWG